MQLNGLGVTNKALSNLLFFLLRNKFSYRKVGGRAVDGLVDADGLGDDDGLVDPDKVGVGVDPEDASNIILVYLAEKENKLLQVKQVYY